MITVTFGSGNSVTRGINGFENYESVLRDERVSAGLGLPTGSAAKGLAASVNGLAVELDDCVSDGETIKVTQRAQAKG